MDRAAPPTDRRADAIDRKPLGASVSIQGLSKIYRAHRAIDDVSMEIGAGEFVTILGPSGSGKTSTLMAIAGFLDDYTGRIHIADRQIDHLPPHRRDIGVVFQHLALFPHMTVGENIAFPLRMRGMKRSEIRHKLTEALELIDLGNLEARFPSQLSGGQQQRVALARAIVFSPPLLLLDEPFGALDRKLRERLQVELKLLHRRLGITVIHVTHDQDEAMAISDRIAVMNKGKVEQFSQPKELYAAPRNRFVADFIGDSVFLHGKLNSIVDGICTVEAEDGGIYVAKSPDSVTPGSPVMVIIRPDSLLLGEDAKGSGNELLGEVTDMMFMGDRTKFEFTLRDRDRITTVVPNVSSKPKVLLGDTILIGWRPKDAFVFAHKAPAS
jgi:putative spermidine/putrescine transport system ATP-binding protein